MCVPGPGSSAFPDMGKTRPDVVEAQALAASRTLYPSHLIDVLHQMGGAEWCIPFANVLHF